jgi:hypothetical protein
MPRRRISIDAARDVIWGRRDAPGIIEELVGFGPATGALKNVHFMNDLAQTVLGGLPADGGDFVCRVIREGVGKEDEDNTETTLRADGRFGGAFSRAYPAQLGTAQVRRLRLGARALLNIDEGIYAPGTQMASSVATHAALLGAEGFRRFRMGTFIAGILDEDARSRVRALYTSDADPVSRALKPLFQQGALAPDRSSRAALARRPTAFDRDLGAALGLILRQPLSKPAILRTFALGSCLGFILKVFGAGADDGRPVLLALGADEDVPAGPLREKAVLSLRRGGADLDRRLAHLVADSKEAKGLWRDAKAGEAAVEVADDAPSEMAQSLIEALRRVKGDDDADTKKMYWPQESILALGRRAGLIQPRNLKAGWGSYLALSSEMVEVLGLMLLPWGERMSWRAFWALVRERFGFIIGANDDDDMNRLNAAGVLNVSLEELSDNSERLLEYSVRRGIARRLPDSGAEIGGYEE